MKKFISLVCLMSFIILQSMAVFAHSFGLYPNNCVNNYLKPNQTPPYSQAIISNRIYPDYSWNGYNSCIGKKICVHNPQVIYDNVGLFPIGSFIERAGKNYFMYTNGVFARNTWLNTKGKWYYFDSSSEMLRGWVTINELTYYFNNDGSMATGTTIIDGVTHYFDASGANVF